MVVLADVVRELSDQSRHPPGGDGCIGACYEALLRLLERHASARELLVSTLGSRRWTPQHFVNLLFRSLQYIELVHRANSAYPHEFIEASRWEAELEDIVRREPALLRGLLLSRNTVTTLYQRYAGPRAVIAALYPRPGRVGVADLGCGGNVGLPGLSLGEPFRAIIDRTRYGTVSRLLEVPIEVAGTAVDREDVQDPAFDPWLIACSFYPQELGEAEALRALRRRTSRAERVGFLRGDIRSLPVTCTGNAVPLGFDVAVLCTVLYQMEADEQRAALEGAVRLLGPRGIVVVQDFARKEATSPLGIRFDVGWFSSAFAYRTFVCGPLTDWEMREVLRWSNGRCLEVEEGEDFGLLLGPHPGEGGAEADVPRPLPGGDG